MNYLYFVLTFVFAVQFVQGTEIKLVPADGSASAIYGVSVDIYGADAIVGAKLDGGVGSAYIYYRSGSTWAQRAKISADDAASDDKFGGAVSISGDYAIVGACFDDDNGSNSGAAYIFYWNGSNWSQQAKLLADDGAAWDVFGYSVAISGDYVVVGAYQDHDDGNYSGSAYVFLRTGTSWSQQAKLTAADAAADDRLGRSVAIDGDYIIVGAEESGDYGAAFIFLRDGTSWSQQAKLVSTDTETVTMFGFDVDISGSRAAIGVYKDTENGFQSGAAYVFLRSGSAWAQEARILADDEIANDLFGFAISISGTSLVVGSHQDDDNGSRSGSIYSFQYNGSSWEQKSKQTASDGSSEDYYGYAVSIDDDCTLVGSKLDDDNGSNSGSAYIYTASDLSLPVSLSSFTVTRTKKNLLVLQWTTESEIENLGFILGRRNGDGNWLEIASYETDVDLVGQGSVSYRTEYSYQDKSVIPGTIYDYRLADVSYSGDKEYHYLEIKNAMTLTLPQDFILKQAYPNPFNPSTTISYFLPEQSTAILTVYDVQGRQITTLQDGIKAPGSYKVQWNGVDQSGNPVSTGVYFCRLQAGNFSQTIKMVYLR